MKTKKTPHTYSSKQMEEIQEYISTQFGDECESIAHEKVSEYVHTDAMVLAPKGKTHTFVTFGMGARSMTSPIGEKRCELVMFSSDQVDLVSEKKMWIAAELTSISKYPFRENCWLGNGHTMNASNRFREKFGYDGYAFWKISEPVTLSNIHEPIEFLQVVPLYEEEIQWCIQNHTIALLEKLEEKYGRDLLLADLSRPSLLPEPLTEEEINLYNTMIFFGIDRVTCEELFDWIASVEAQGQEVTEEDVTQWLSEEDE